MGCTEQQEQQQGEEDEVVEVPEIDGDLLVELLDASLAGAEEEEPDDEATERQPGFTADLFSEDSIHPHHDCEDCGLDDGGVMSDFDEFDGCESSRSPSPYAVFDDDDAAAALGPFVVVDECMSEWYMDGMAMDMDMEWEDDDDEGMNDDLSFGPYYYGGEIGAEQEYGSPLWQ